MLSDCPKCLNTPCTCGYEYRDWSISALEEQIKMLEDVLKNCKVSCADCGIPLFHSNDIISAYGRTFWEGGQIITEYICDECCDVEVK